VSRRPKRSWSDRAELVRDVALLARIEWGLRRSTLPKLVGRLGIGWGGAPKAIDPEVDALPSWAGRRFRIALAVCKRWPFGDTCLRRSLLIGNRLSSLEPVLRIGVDRPAEGLLAHAWLEIDGRSLDPESKNFATMQFVSEA
jgi:hypothetical protein